MLLADNKFIECNDATLLIFACSNKNSFLNRSFSYFSPLKQPCGKLSKSLENEYIAKALQEGKVSFSWTYQRLNDETFSAEVLLTSFCLKNQNLIQATVRDITQLLEVQKNLMFLSMHDQLTGLYNRNALVSIFDKELDCSKRHDHFFSVLMLDVDLFKQINDTYAHQTGDDVLVHFANELLSMLRSSDMVVRFGGDEMLVLLPETDIRGAKQLAERIRKNIENAVSVAEKEQLGYTVSIGVACYPKDGSDKQHLLASADKALYAEKTSGRNKVCLC